MLQLFYSNKALSAQSSTAESLGGYISCNPILNGQGEGIFLNTSLRPFGKKDEYRGFFIKNVGSEIVSNFHLFILATETATYEAAFVLPSSQKTIEIIPNAQATPTFAVFTNVVSQFATTTVQVMGEGGANEIVQFDGLIIQLPDYPTSAEEVCKILFDVLKDQDLYSPVRTTPTSILLTYPILGDFDDQIDWSSYGGVILSIPRFSGGVDNSIFFEAIPLAPGESIGLWLKREYSTVKKTCTDLYQVWKTENPTNLFSNEDINTPLNLSEDFKLILEY